MDGGLSHVIRKRMSQQLEEDDAQGIDIASRIDVARICFDLLGTHVLKCPDQSADIRLKRGHDKIRVGTSGDSEIDDLRFT